MKFIIILIISISLSTRAGAQFQYNITSSPDSALVFFNGEERCVTPCKVSYYWKDNKDGLITLSVQAPGYEPWYDTISSKPREFDKRASLTLAPVIGTLTFDSLSPLIGFDKLLFSLEDGQVLGSFTGEDGVSKPIKWEGSTKLGSTVFDRTFYKRMTAYGYNTPYSVSYKLFSEDEKKKLLPRYVVGVKIIDYSVQKFHRADKAYRKSPYATKVRLKLEWQVMDKSTDRVVFSHINEGTYRKSEYSASAGKDIALEAFEMALIDFAEKSEFHQLIQSSTPLAPVVLPSEEQAEIHIQEVKSPAFSKLSEMIQYTSMSCVTIVTDAGHGSGWILSEDGYVLTSNHVVQGVNKIKISLASGIELSCELIAFNSAKDVALLKMDGKGFQALPVLREMPGLGEEVVTIGTPADIELGQSVSRGMVSGKRMVDGHAYIQMDMAVSPGNSGGPLLNSDGKVIGIVQKKLVGEGIEGIGFAVPIDAALEMLKIVVK